MKMLTLHITAFLVSCLSGITPPTGSARATDSGADQKVKYDCSRDPTEVATGDKVIEDDHVGLVSLNLQWEALKFLDGAKVKKLTKAEERHFWAPVGMQKSPAYLVRICIFTMAPPKPPSQLDFHQDLFERAVYATHFSFGYAETQAALTVRTFALAPRDAKAEPVAFIVWYDKPILDIRIHSHNIE